MIRVVGLDTLPKVPIERLALPPIDASSANRPSTRKMLEASCDKVVAGGFIIVDDYGTFCTVPGDGG